MDTVLVVGASGQLGTAVTRRLLNRGAAVRTLVRTPDQSARFLALGAEPVHGDLTDAESLRRACGGASAVVATANAAMPSRGRDTFEAVERDGYRNLIEAAAAARVRRFVYTSVPLTAHDGISSFLRFKRETERRLQASGLDHVIFRADIFMDVTFAMMGSSLPLRGAEGATALRPFAFANRHLACVKDNIEHKHVALVPGEGRKRHAFICVEDVAAFLEGAACGGPSGTFAAAGPEALSFLDVVGIYERLLGTGVRVRTTPAAVFRVLATVLRPFSPAAANLMALNYIGATSESFPDPESARAFGVRLTTAEEFLRAKNTLRATA